LLAAGITFWIDTSDFPAIVWENPHYGYNVPGVVNDNKNLFIHTSLESFPYRGAVLAIHLARLLSVLIGALGVWFTYLLALEIFPGQRFLAALAASIVAFNPQFLFISSAVSNDSTIVTLSALSLWLMIRVASGDRRPVIVLALGVACGLAALAKVSGLGLVVLAVLVFAWQIFRLILGGKNAELRTLTSEIALFTFVFLLVAGWWYGRNLMLYGELTGTMRMREIFHVRVAPMSLEQLLVQLREVWETFWIGFGWGNIRAHPPIYALIEIFVALGVLGWILAIPQSRLVNSQYATRHSSFAIHDSSPAIYAPFAILFAWVMLMFAAIIYWMQTTQAPHGRLFFPALPALAVLLAVGLKQFQWLEIGGQRSESIFRISRFTLYGLLLPFVFLLFACSMLAPFLVLQPAYTYPPTLNADEISRVPNRVDISYDDKIMLLGYDVSARRISPGDSIQLTLYWQALTVMEEDYSVGISVVDEQQRVIGTRNTYPGKGMLPTRLWYAGQAIRDEYWLPIKADATAGVAQIQVAVYERTRRRDLVARDPRGEIITPFIGQIEIVSK
jgi:hypothetical protein